jgi:hypothetical protein
VDEYEVTVPTVHAQLFRVRASSPRDAIERVKSDQEHYTGPVVHQRDLPEDQWTAKRVDKESR